MGMAAEFTDDTTDFEIKLAGRCFNKTMVIRMNRQPAGMSAWTGELMELKIVYDFIIKIWCKGIVFFDE